LRMAKHTCEMQQAASPALHCTTHFTAALSHIHTSLLLLLLLHACRGPGSRSKG
jgi:hypothetical protein